MRNLVIAVMGLLVAVAATAEIKLPTKEEAMPKETSTPPVVVIETSMGTMKAKLWQDTSPITVANFLKYVDEGFFDGTVFHRVMEGFMVQGGGFLPGMKEKPSGSPIKNEASREALNKRGTLAMARTTVVDSATSQFFVNLVDNAFLDHKDKSPRGFGYCAFGKLTDGLDVLDAIGKVKTTRVGPHGDVPAEDVLIKSIRREKAPDPTDG